LPLNTVIVSRPSKWGNPYKIGVDARTASQCVDLFEVAVSQNKDYQLDAQRLLRGKNLACWCPLGSPCHRDVLLRIANE
jgi:hypothetical protein